MDQIEASLAYSELSEKGRFKEIQWSGKEQYLTDEDEERLERKGNCDWF